MKILIVSFSINHSMGDNFKMTARCLSQTDNEVYVLTNEGLDKSVLGTENICNVRFDRKKPFDFVNPLSYLKILRFVRSVKFDVCFLCSPHPANLFIYNIVDNKKIIPYVHDHIMHSGVGGIDAYALKLQLKKFYNCSPKVIVSCDYIKNDILKHGFIKDPDRIEVNYLGLLDNLCHPKADYDKQIDVLFFGRIEYYKALDVLVEAGKSLPGVKFTIAGKGNLKEVFGIEQLPENFDHQNRYIPDDELAAMIQNAKVVVLPYRDATGTQTIQSIFYFKKPVIATSAGCFPEYITDGLDGVIIRPENADDLKNAIVHLLSDGELREKMGVAGYKKLETIFSNENITNRYLEIFESL